MSVTTKASAGSASVQGELWGARARDYAEVQEPTFLPLYESVLARPEVAKANSILDVGCGPGLATQVFSRSDRDRSRVPMPPRPSLRSRVGGCLVGISEWPKCKRCLTPTARSML